MVGHQKGISSDEIGLRAQSILLIPSSMVTQFGKAYVTTKREENRREKKRKETSQLQPLLFFASRLLSWYMKWQYAWFTIVEQIWQFSIQSNGRDLTRSWKCPPWVHETLGTLNGRLYDLMKQQQQQRERMWCQVSLTHKQARMEAKALLSRIGAHPQKFGCTRLELLFRAQLVHWEQN